VLELLLPVKIVSAAAPFSLRSHSARVRHRCSAYRDRSDVGVEVEDSREGVAANSLLVDRTFNNVNRILPRFIPLIREVRIFPVANDKQSGERSRQLVRRGRPYLEQLGPR